MVIFITLPLQGCSGHTLKHWHRARLFEEFKAGMSDEVTTFEDYLQLGERLFEQLEEEV
jgi:hypothetical protein